MDPEDGFLLKDSIKSGEVREVSKNIALRGVYEMCFENKGIPNSIYFIPLFHSANYKFYLLFM